MIYENENINVVTVFGGVPVSVNERQFRENIDILVGTPGRIIDLVNRGILKFENVKTVCIDEADFMFDIGFQVSID